MKFALAVALVCSGCSLIDGLSGEEDTGSIISRWEIREGGNPRSCFDVASVGVRVEVAGFMDVFDCNPPTGTSADIPVGTHVVLLRLLGPGDSVMDTVEKMAIIEAGRTIQLPLATFQVGAAAL
jgi:hypothetical protein